MQPFNTKIDTFAGNKVNNRKTVILLAAGKLAASVRSAYGSTSVAMLPIGGRPLIQRSLSYFKDAGYQEAIIGIRPDEKRLQKFVQQVFSKELAIHFVEIEVDRGPGGTLLECLKHKACGRKVTCVLGDTLFKFPQKESLDEVDYVLTVNEAPDATRWCFVKKGAGDRVLSLKDKPDEQPDNWPLLIGVYHILDKEPGMRALEDRSRADILEMRHFLQPYIESGTLQAYQADEWSDCGNIDQLIGSQRRLIQSREFNELQIDELRGTITKRSKNQLKLVDEINYYRLLPSELQTFYPRIIDFSIKPDDVFLTLEYYGYPTLSELWTFEELEIRLWRKIFGRLHSVLDCFQEYAMDVPNKEIEKFYWGKLVSRIEQFSGQSSLFRELVEAEVLTVNGRNLSGWPVIRPWLQGKVHELSQGCKAQVIHGDLCFSNILFDPLSHAFKMIDVRGNFGSSGIYGDPRYDVAKLLHSINGGYDFLIHDMFSVSHDDLTINYQQFFPEVRHAVLDAFCDCFSERYNLTEIRLIEGTLFLSMPPLHSDSFQRQIAMFAIGIEILNRLMNDENMY